jgi:hypothetical protein
MLGALSCAPKAAKVDEMKAPDLGLIYGQVRLPDPGWDLNLIMIQRVGKVYAGMGLSGLSEKVQFAADGRYFAENLKPGKYMLAGIIIGRNRNFLGKEALNYTIEVKAGGLHYMGTYNYMIVSGGSMIRPGKFELKPDRSRATHVNILAWLEEAARGTRWHAGIQKRLSALQQD